MSILKRTKITRLLFFVTADSIIIAGSILLSFWLRFDSSIPLQYLPFLWRMIVLAIFFSIPVFYINRLYLFSWSYVSTSELIALFRACTISFALLALVIYLSPSFPAFNNFPRSVIVVSYLITFLFCGGIRVSKRLYVHAKGSDSRISRERTLIVGAGDVGEQILRNMLSARTSSYLPIGFVDDNALKQGVMIHGLKVLGTILDIPSIIALHNIKQVVVAMPSASSKVIKEAVELARKGGSHKIKIVPPMSEFMRGEASLKNLRDVHIEDLLGRNPINIDSRQIEQLIKNKKVLITGAAGSIGSELAHQVARYYPSDIFLLDQDETGIFTITKKLKNAFSHIPFHSLIADITDEKKIEVIYKNYTPDIVFHAAAYKHVPLMEIHVDEAVKNNILGTEILAKAAIAHHVETFIFISTDKAVNPTSVMGATKRVGEMLCQLYNQQQKTKFISVRFGNVLDSRGSVIPIFREQIKQGGPVEVTDAKMQRYFMLTSEACLLVMQAAAIGKGGEVFVLDMGKPVFILELAKEMIRLSGFEPDKDIAITFIGLRPGEKLFEEILTAEEGTLVTQHQKIFMAKPAAIDKTIFNEKLNHLSETLIKGDVKEMITILKTMVPYYV